MYKPAVLLGVLRKATSASLVRQYFSLAVQRTTLPTSCTNYIFSEEKLRKKLIVFEYQCTLLVFPQNILQGVKIRLNTCYTLCIELRRLALNISPGLCFKVDLGSEACLGFMALSGFNV